MKQKNFLKIEITIGAFHIPVLLTISLNIPARLIRFQYSRKADPLIFYTLKFRIVRFKISEDTYETVITNLPADNYSPEDLKKLYASRWGIETSFRDLKYTIGLLKYHSKKTACIRQEIFARLTLYNFVEVITSHVARTYADFSCADKHRRLM